MKIALIMGLVVVLISLTGCAAVPGYKGVKNEDSTTSKSSLPYTVSYFHDTEHKVGIWTFKSGDSGGIFVLPDSEYKITGN